MLGNPNTFYLSNAEYIEEKRRISIEFSNLSETKRVSFPFVPCILIHKEFLDSASIDYLNSLKEIRIEEISNGLKVFASNFSFLKELNQSVGKKGILLPPETQFLLSKNWSFFDAFELNGEIKKNNLSEFPEIRFDFAFDSLKDNAFEILAGSKKEGTDFLNKIVLSNILTLKLTSLPVSKAKVFDFFIESICFKNNFAFNKKNPKFDSGFVEKKHFEKLKEIDFSFVWPVLFSFPFYNLGFDSVNCACCKPSELNNKNILPSSLIEVKFLEDGIYFSSFNSVWAGFFHSVASGKEKRIKRMNEWKLDSIPLGPFFRNDVLRIPLDDALKLKNEGKVVFLFDHYLNWCCKKNESFISKELNELNKKIVFFEKKVNELEVNSIKENGIAFSLHLDENVEFHFFSEQKNALREIFSVIPFHLSSLSSAFFDPVFSNSIKCIFGSVLGKFRDFSLSNSSRPFISEKKVLVDSDNTFDLLLEFSKNQNIPVPEMVISGNKT